MLSVKQGGIKYHFWVFGITRPGIEPRSPEPLASTLTILPMARLLLDAIMGYYYCSWVVEFYTHWYIYIYIEREREREIVDWENPTRSEKINEKGDKAKHRKRIQINNSSKSSSECWTFCRSLWWNKDEILIWIRCLCFGLTSFSFIFHTHAHTHTHIYSERESERERERERERETVCGIFRQLSFFQTCFVKNCRQGFLKYFIDY